MLNAEASVQRHEDRLNIDRALRVVVIALFPTQCEITIHPGARVRAVRGLLPGQKNVRREVKIILISFETKRDIA